MKYLFVFLLMCSAVMEIVIIYAFVTDKISVTVFLLQATLHLGLMILALLNLRKIYSGRILNK